MSVMHDLPPSAIAEVAIQKPLKEPSGRLCGHRGETIVGSSPRADKQPGLHSAQRLMIYLSTARRLGVANVTRVVIYRACKRAGLYRWLLPQRKAIPLGLRIDSSHNAAQLLTPLADRAVLTEA